MPELQSEPGEMTVPTAAKPKEEIKYIFSTPPSAAAVEWAGVPIGASNTVTRTKGRTKIHDKVVDKTPGKLEKLIHSATGAIRAARPQNALQHDVIIHGIRVRAVANSQHLFDYWVDNWYSVSEWESITGHKPTEEPKIMVHAFGGVENEEEAAYYSRKGNTIVFFNTSYYGQLKSWVLGAVGRVLAEEQGIHSIHGACMERLKKGILYIAPTGTGKSTSSYGLMGTPGSRFHSDDWVYVRYAYRLKNGGLSCPMRITDSGKEVAVGFQVYRWLEENRSKSNAEISGMDLKNAPVKAKLADIDFSKPVEAYAYTSEKVFYLRSNLVESFAETAYPILQSKLENCPEVTPAFMEMEKTTISGIVSRLQNLEDGELKNYFRSIDPTRLGEIAARLYAFDNTRAMLDIKKVFGEERVYTNPMEPVRLANVMLLKRDFGSSDVLQSLPLPLFMAKLLIGETPDKKREVAYNAYRAVDDAEEKAFIDRIELQNGGKLDGSFYELYASTDGKPHTLYQEFELFRVMHQSAGCYALNTILQNDKKLKDKREAVLRSHALIAKTLDTQSLELHLTLENYDHFLK